MANLIVSLVALIVMTATPLVAHATPKARRPPIVLPAAGAHIPSTPQAALADLSQVFGMPWTLAPGAEKDPCQSYQIAAFWEELRLARYTPAAIAVVQDLKALLASRYSQVVLSPTAIPTRLVGQYTLLRYSKIDTALDPEWGVGQIVGDRFLDGDTLAIEGDRNARIATTFTTTGHTLTIGATAFGAPAGGRILDFTPEDYPYFPYQPDPQKYYFGIHSTHDPAFVEALRERYIGPAKHKSGAWPVLCPDSLSETQVWLWQLQKLLQDGATHGPELGLGINAHATNCPENAHVDDKVGSLARALNEIGGQIH